MKFKKPFPRFVLLAALAVLAVWLFDASAGPVPGTAIEPGAKIKDLAKVAGVATAFQYLKTNYEPLSPGVHDLAHLVGILAYQEQQEKGLLVCDESFSYGCYHGFFIEFFKTEASQGIKVADAACQTLGKPGAIASCVHGIGHGIHIWKDYELSAALQTCDSEISAPSHDHCYDGVFMENISPNTDAGLVHRREFAADPWSVCRGLTEKYQFACSREQPFFLNSVSAGDLRETTRACLAAPSLLMRAGCSEGTGLLIAQSTRGRVRETAALCRLFPEEDDFTRCLKASAREFVFQYLLTDEALALCGEFTDLTKREACQRDVLDMPSSYDL